MKDYRKSIKDTAKVYMKEYKDKIAETQKKYREKNKDKIKKYKKNHNKIYYSNYIRERLKNDELFRLTFNIRSAIRRSFKRKGYCKKSKTEKILGCTFLEFKNHIEAQFEPWMNWTNYGLYNGTPNFGWDIDHILCIKTANTEEDVIKLNHYTNLQPLCSYCNRNIKRCKIQ